jgi:hypothetical protein
MTPYTLNCLIYIINTFRSLYTTIPLVLMPQTTIVAALNGSLNLSRAPRPGPRPNPLNQLSSSSLNSRVGTRTVLPDGTLGRRWEGGASEQSVLALFTERRRQLADGIEDYESELDEDGDPIPLTRHSYTREHKLAAIDYALHTWRVNKEGKEERISYRRAAKKLGITDVTLRSWVRSRNKILLQKKGSRRARGSGVGTEDQMEGLLEKEFEKARAQGRQITHRWFVRHAKAIYRELYPHRATQDSETGRWQHTGFNFSNSWFQGFLRRKCISLRNRTKRAQKAPEELAPVIQKWLQYNRRMIVIRPKSDCGKPHGPSFPTVGRFKLCNISNMCWNYSCVAALVGYTTGLFYGFTLRVYSTGLLYRFTLRVYSTGLLSGSLPGSIIRLLLRTPVLIIFVYIYGASCPSS